MSEKPDLDCSANEVTLWGRPEMPFASLALRLDRRLVAAESRFAERLSAQAMAIAIAKSASETAITVAMAASKTVRKDGTPSNKRFVCMSEFCTSLGEVVAKQMPRDEAEAQLNSLSERLEGVVRRIARSERSGQGLKAGWLILFGLISAVGGAASIVVVT